jgi:xylose isomerase
MSWELILINVLAIACIVLAFTTYNLMVKNEKLEDIIHSYRDYISKLQTQITYTEEKVKKIDERGTFRSDDEIGWFFKNIKSLQESLSKFKIDI